MSKGVYVGVNGIAQKVKKMYVGVGDVARKIKKGYIGIGGVARPFFGGGEPAYYGAVTSLHMSKYYLAAGSVGDYALFAGGRGKDMDTTVSKVEAYNSSLVKSTATSMRTERNTHTATIVPDSYVIFAGGVNTSNSPQENADAYNASLTKTNVAFARPTENMAATHVGNYGLLAGGVYGAYTVSSGAKVKAFDKSLTQSYPTALSTTRQSAVGGHVGNYAIIAGGFEGSNADSQVKAATADCYNASLTKTPISNLSASAYGGASASVEGYAIFVVATDIANAYNASLTRTILPVPGIKPDMATAVNGIAFFAGDDDSTKTLAYDGSLTRTEFDAYGYFGGAAASVGNFALFAGGRKSRTIISSVKAYTVA